MPLKNHSEKISKALKLFFPFLITITVYTSLSTVYLRPESVNTILSVKMHQVTDITTKITFEMKIDSFKHGALGLLLGSLTLNPWYTVFTVFTSVLIDLDHTPYFLGIPVPPRVSHSLFFLLPSTIIYQTMFKEGKLTVTWITSFTLHISLDNLRVPILSPFLLSPEPPQKLIPFLITAAYTTNLYLGLKKLRKKKS